MATLFVRVPLLVGLLIGTPISAQVTWTQVATTVAPAPRAGHAVAYDAARGRVVLFGGHDSSLQHLSDTWEWDGTNWTRRLPPTSPPARVGHALAYDSARNRTVLFGGQGSAVSNDTWEWDGTNWTQRTPATSPTARMYFGLAYDSARGRTVLFGGHDGRLQVSDTWEWDGTNWTQRLPASWPPARDSHSLAFDSRRSRTVLFSSRSGFFWLNDTWEWDGTNWIQLMPTTIPPEKSRYGFTYDSARGRTVLWGGGGPAGILPDTWEWDGRDWTRRLSPTTPPARGSPALAYDSARARTVLFGGVDSNNVLLADTWVYLAVNPASYTALGTGCAGTAGTPTLAPTPGHLPWLGDSFTLQVRNLPATAPVVYLFGNSNTAWGSLTLPADLTPIGMNGCVLRAAGIVTLPMLNQAGTASITFAIPTVRYLVRAPFYDQAFVFDQLANPFGATLSSAGELRFGER